MMFGKTFFYTLSTLKISRKVGEIDMKQYSWNYFFRTHKNKSVSEL
jgi:hypothetical protein